MFKHRSQRAALTAVALFSLAGCSSGDGTSTASLNDEQQAFSEDDRRAALALSISQQSALSTAESPYKSALLCNIGMDSLAERLEEAGGLEAQQIEALRLGREHFERQLRDAGQAEGKTASDIASDLEQTASGLGDSSDYARIAIACIRRAQESG